MLESALTERQLVTHFIDALSELPEVQAKLDHWELVSSQHGDHRYDAQVNLHVADQSYVLLVEAKKSVFPRDVRQVIWKFRWEASQRQPAGPTLFIH